MTATLNTRLTQTFAPPVMEARRWVAEATLPEGTDLLNVAQAAPSDPPPEGLRAALAAALEDDPSAHLYGAVFGREDLREEVASQWSTAYGGRIAPGNVAITSGCNQAFCAAIATLASAGDNVILPAPWYFNHRMWLGMQGIDTRVLMCGDTMLPSVEDARMLIDDRTRAIVLVTPNNPTGVEYPPALIRAFFDLARETGLALIIDETYRDFHSATDAPHDLFTDADWGDTLIHLYSFSKAYRLTGYRVGALIAAPRVLAEVEKFLDTMTICPSQLGQIGALYGMQNLRQWVAGERAEILSRRAAIEEGFPKVPGWRVKGAGAYFAYVEHPYDASSDTVAQRLVSDIGVLMLPGTMFAPTLADGGSGSAERHMRVAFANVDVPGLHDLFDRLRSDRP